MNGEVQIETYKEAFLKELGEIIRKHRKKENISQKELAEFLDVSNSTVSRIESGKTDLTASMLFLISAYCNFGMEEYFKNADVDELSQTFSKLVRKSHRPKTMMVKEENTYAMKDMCHMDFMDMFETPLSEENFKEYLSKEENTDKRKLLLAASMAYAVIDSSGDKEFLMEFSDQIVDYVLKEPQQRLRKRLEKYVGQLCKMGIC